MWNESGNKRKMRKYDAAVLFCVEVRKHESLLVGWKQAVKVSENIKRSYK